MAKTLEQIVATSLNGVLLMSLLVMANVGCSDGKALVVVKGKVNVEGLPANGAVVLFHPDGDATKMTASGVVTEDGSFTLSSALDKGIAPGTYTVTITWPDPTVETTPAEMMQGMIADAPDLLKGAYATRDSSQLKAEITTSSTEIPPFELEIP